MATSSNDPMSEIADLMREMIRLQGGSSAVGVRPKKADPSLDNAVDRLNLLKNVREYAKGMKEATSVAKSLTNVFDGVREEMNFEAAGQGLSELNKALGKTTDSVEVAAIKEQRAELTKAVAVKTAVTTAANFAGGMLKAANMILDSSRAFELSIQSGASGVEAGTQNLIASIQAEKQIKDAEADVVKDVSGGLGALALMIPRYGKIIGAAITLLGPLVSSFLKFNNDQEAKAKEHQVKLFGEELKKTEENYHAITAAGASFAGGMGEMREQAANAGMRLKDFSEMIKGSVANLANMGMGVAQAAQRIGGVSKVLRSTDLGMQLRNLGLSAQEQSEAAAATAATLNSSGKLRTMSDSQVAQATVAYTKDLKILQGITGEDAKKKLEEARVRSMEADLMARTMAEGGPEAMLKLQKQLASMPESMKKGYMEFVSTGGTAIADAATNVAISQNPKIMEQYQQMFGTLGNTNKDASAAQAETIGLNEQTTKYAREHADSIKEMATAGRLGASELGQATTQIHNDLILANQKFTEGVGQATADNVEKLSKTQDPLTKSVNRLEEETNTAAVVLEKRLTPQLSAAADAMPRFTGAMKNAYEVLEGMTGKSGADISKDSQNWEKMSGGEKFVSGTARAVETIGTIIPFADGLIDRARKERIAGETEYLNKGDRETRKKELSWANPASWFAKGGVAEGPKTGFPAMLHGTEAVVPLPDGKSLPVNLDMGTGFFDSFQSSIQQVSGALDEKVNSVMKQNPVIDELYKKVSGALGDTANSVMTQNPMIGDLVNSFKTNVAPNISGFDMPSIFSKVSGLATGALTKADPAGTTTGISDEVMKTFNDTISTLNKKTDSSEGNNTLKEMRDLIKSQLSKHDEMIAKLSENIDVNQRLLNHSYN